MGTATWHGIRVMRISVSGWSTTDADIDRSVQAVRDALERAAAPQPVRYSSS